jgi:hypothetical protein
MRTKFDNPNFTDEEYLWIHEWLEMRFKESPNEERQLISDVTSKIGLAGLSIKFQNELDELLYNPLDDWDIDEHDNN